MQRDAACIFCRIVADEAHASRIYEDEATLVFLDHAPAHRGHTLVVTKEHFADMFEAGAEALRAVMGTAHRVAPAVRKVIEPAGVRVIQLNGAPAGQTVFHYHLHLIPCGHDGVMRVHGRAVAERSQLDRLAEEIRGALAT